jgi:hypothetical protein
MKRHKINYSYIDANCIPKMNKYLMECNLEMKLIKLSWDIVNSKIVIIFKSNFEVRKTLADKLREFDPWPEEELL